MAHPKTQEAVLALQMSSKSRLFITKYLAGWISWILTGANGLGCTHSFANCVPPKAGSAQGKKDDTVVRNGIRVVFLLKLLLFVFGSM